MPFLHTRPIYSNHAIYLCLEHLSNYYNIIKKINDYIKRILKAYESAVTSFNIRESFKLAGLYILTKTKKCKLEYHPEVKKKK